MPKYSYEQYAVELKKDEELVPRAVAIIRRTVKLHGPREFQKAVDDLRPLPVDRGTYRRSVKVDDIPGGARFYNFAVHAGIIELGRRPGARMPPLWVIEQWVIRKGLVKVQAVRKLVLTPKEFARAKRNESRVLAQMARARRVAYLIARAIAQRGLPARFVLERAAAAVDQRVQFEIKHQLVLGGAK